MKFSPKFVFSVMIFLSICFTSNVSASYLRLILKDNVALIPTNVYLKVIGDDVAMIEGKAEATKFTYTEVCEKSERGRYEIKFGEKTLIATSDGLLKLVSWLARERDPLCWDFARQSSDSDDLTGYYLYEMRETCMILEPVRA